MLGRIAVVLLLILASCARPTSEAYREMYAHLDWPKPCCKTIHETDYFLVILVDARHLDYSDCRSFITTVAKHPSDMSKTGDVGHAWIFLQGRQNCVPVYLEGGFSGERGMNQPRYVDGMMNYVDYGCLDPDKDPMGYEPNPAKYLWEVQHDGFFQWGPGKHRPNYAAKITLTEEQFTAIARFVENYDYANYSLVSNQCCTFITEIGSLIGLDLETNVSLPIDSEIDFGSNRMVLWTDPQYAELPLSTPDFLEKRLMELVAEGQAEYALDWYRERHPRQKTICWETITKFPSRFAKYCYMR